MKFTTIAALVGVASTIQVEQTDDNLMQQSAEMEQLCQNMGEIDEESLVQTEAEADESEDRKKVSGTSKQHYNRSTKQINAENHHILSTQSKCLNFVRKYRGHPKVCNWCKKAKAPSVIWKWDHSGKVWYRWYDNKWHYWGPSKRGFTSVGWTWYKGFWHHNGWVFKYTGGYWYRFQGGKWVRYGRQVPIKPKVPVGPKICRPFYLLRKWGFPSSLGSKRLPRCKVGSGRSAAYYMWKNRKACRFLGGKLVYQTHKTCKTGKPHQWARVTRCVAGPTISKLGLNYKTGRKYGTRQYKKGTYFNSNAPSKTFKIRKSKVSVTTDSRGVKVYNFKNGWTQWQGSQIKSLPDKNFVISMDFRTKQTTVGLFEFHYKGYDREIGLKNGKPYVRVWRGVGWQPKKVTTKYNDYKWHTLKLTVQTGVGQNLYMDGVKVGWFKYDHSDYNWKQILRIGYATDLKKTMNGQMKNIIVKPL